MPARLVSLDGHADIPLDGVVVVVGRHRWCDIRIDSPRVSRRHCCLALEGEGVLARDLGNTNGTRINGLRIEHGILRPGDELSIAHRRYRPEFRRAGEPSPTALHNFYYGSFPSCRLFFRSASRTLWTEV
jgi:hypothetical protein